MKIQIQQAKSFTLIEVLTVVGILVVLAAIAVPAYHYFQAESDLSNTTEEVTTILKLAQNKTLASEGASQWGVFFDNTNIPNRFILFKGVDYPSLDPAFDEVHGLPASVEIYEINLVGGGGKIVFNRISGETAQTGNIVLRLKADSKTKTVYIEQSGKVGLVSPTIPSDAARIKDSRHIHFNYNQNTQGVVTLHLVFPDYPGNNYDISFQDYLNADKTEFSWEGIVSVGLDGSKTEQRLKIHTHGLTFMATQFCIHRPLSSDQSYNNKALNIYLDDQELIEYAADTKGTTTKGSSIWVGEPELQ